jgi:hypothetical protein
MENYNAEYYRKNKKEILAKNKLWRQANQEKIRENKRLYEAKPERRSWKREKSAKDYQLNRKKYLIRQSQRRKERKAFMDAICIYYGCRNPNCKWDGEYQACQLDFHHFNPNEKLTEVAKMESWAYEKIIAEIDKCIVVCRNCHALVHNDSVVLTEDMICKSQDYLKGIK